MGVDYNVCEMCYEIHHSDCVKICDKCGCAFCEECVNENLDKFEFFTLDEYVTREYDGKLPTNMTMEELKSDALNYYFIKKCTACLEEDNTIMNKKRRKGKDHNGRDGK